MKLLTKQMRKEMPPLRATESIPTEDKKLLVKFFCPWNQWTWFAIEGEPQIDDGGAEWDYHFFGYVIGHEKEWGYFSLRELEDVRGPMGLKIERDLYWQPKLFKEL